MQATIAVATPISEEKKAMADRALIFTTSEFIYIAEAVYF